MKSDRRKIPKTLSGIETFAIEILKLLVQDFAGKYLKPYQGLKPGNLRMLADFLRRKIPKTLSGIETLID